MGHLGIRENIGAGTGIELLKGCWGWAERTGALRLRLKNSGGVRWAELVCRLWWLDYNILVDVSKTMAWGASLLSISEDQVSVTRGQPSIFLIPFLVTMKPTTTPPCLSFFLHIITILLAGGSLPVCTPVDDITLNCSFLAMNLLIDFSSTPAAKNSLMFLTKREYFWYVYNIHNNQ